MLDYPPCFNTKHINNARLSTDPLSTFPITDTSTTIVCSNLPTVITASVMYQYVSSAPPSNNKTPSLVLHLPLSSRKSVTPILRDKSFLRHEVETVFAVVNNNLTHLQQLLSLSYSDPQDNLNQLCPNPPSQSPCPSPPPLHIFIINGDSN